MQIRPLSFRPIYRSYAGLYLSLLPFPAFNPFISSGELNLHFSHDELIMRKNTNKVNGYLFKLI